MRAAFHTLGCKTNAYETQAILEQFETAGYEIGDFASACDVYIINTCAVTQEAARKSRQMTSRCKRMNPDALVVVTGCYAQDASEKIRTESLADIIVGNSEKSQILTIVEQRLNQAAENISGSTLTRVKDLTYCQEYENQKITNQGNHVRAYVKIQDGCNRFCSYCLIPFMRGRSRSRRIEDILDEAKNLAAKGYQELVLTGIDISTFCAEQTPGEDLAMLIEKLDAIEEIKRIRLGSLELGIISEAFMKRLKKLKSFCPQFHLSLQSGCDTVLSRMNRHYNTAEYADSVRLIRKYYENAAITTDIITGFPGETEEEFEETIQFTKDIFFSRVHVFPYSRREKTKADKMQGQLTKAVKEDRARRLIAITEQQRQDYEEKLIGTKCTILVEEVISAGNEEVPLYLAGYTPEYVRILVSPKQYQENGQDMINQLIEVVPTAFKDGNLWAE